MKKNYKRLLFFILTCICLLHPHNVSAEDKLVPYNDTLPAYFVYTGWLYFNLDSAWPQAGASHDLLIGGSLHQSCGTGDTWRGNNTWWYGNTCYSLPGTLTRGDRLYRLYRNGILCPGGMTFSHGISAPNPPGASVSPQICEGQMGGPIAWSTSVNVATEAGGAGSMHIGYEYRADPYDRVQHYAPTVDGTVATPANAWSNTRSNISGVFKVVEKHIGDSVPLIPENIIKGAVTNATLTYVSGDDTTTNGRYTVPVRTILLGSNLIQDNKFTTVGTVRITWGVRDWQGDQTNFTVQYNVTNPNFNYKVTADAGGTATPTAEGTALQGGEIAINATPSAGYEFDRWVVVDGKAPASYTSAVTVANNKFTMPASDVHIKATFKKINYKYKVTADAGGTATPTAEGTGTLGTEIAIVATPALGYEFDRWVVVDGKAPASYTSAVTVANNRFTMPTSDVHIKATFKKINYTVTAYGEPGKGTGTADKSTANMGDVVTLSATPEPGFMFVGWVVKNGTITDTDFDPTKPNTTFKMPASNVELQATFAPIPAAGITIRKTVVGTKGNANDIFLINLHEGSKLITSIALKDGNTSNALAIDLGSAASKAIKVSEIIPMDYDGTKVKVTVANKAGSKATVSGDIVTIYPGDDVTITVENTFAPTGYFKGKDFVKNIFK